MKESYIKIVDSQHASSELIQLTKNRMRDALEESNNTENTISEDGVTDFKVKPVYNLRKSYKYLGMAAALLIVLTIGGVWGVSNNIEYENINSLAKGVGNLNFGLIEKGKYEVSIEEVEEEFETDILKVDTLGGNTLSDAKASIIYSEEDDIFGEVVASYGEYTLEISIGKDNILPQLKTAKANNISNIDVYFGYDENNETRIACFSYDSVFYKISTEDISKSEFNKTVKSFIKENFN